MQTITPICPSQYSHSEISIFFFLSQGINFSLNASHEKKFMSVCTSFALWKECRNFIQCIESRKHKKQLTKSFHIFQVSDQIQIILKF